MASRIVCLHPPSFEYGRRARAAVAAVLPFGSLIETSMPGVQLCHWECVGGRNADTRCDGGVWSITPTPTATQRRHSSSGMAGPQPTAVISGPPAIPITLPTRKSLCRPRMSQITTYGCAAVRRRAWRRCMSVPSTVATGALGFIPTAYVGVTDRRLSNHSHLRPKSA